ncbi:MAG TPA: chemotaxis response regulator protein-glutamate methylesterase [Burkholderiales bacterium]|nr:chemotaxis response regulator protein-glutamate methylesterase [Burkholderiales bacterium]
MEQIKVLIVDDSALIRKVLTEIINRESDMTVVGAAPDPYAAREMIKAAKPDVLTLDVEMPKMDGLDFLERLMRLHPMPVVMVSTLTEEGSETALRALELGAIDFIAKPKMEISKGMAELAEGIVERIRIAAKARIRRGEAPLGAIVPAAWGNRRLSTEKLIIVGASTGGTEALRDFLTRLPPDAPAVLITQHMPPGFTATFAKRLDGLCRITVKEAEHGERILPGHAYIAPGSHHLVVQRSGANYVTALSDAPPVNRHRPSVEVLFRSAAEVVGPNAVGIMMTGMGKDGASAMLEMKNAGAYNIAQNEATCIVYGMPREAVAIGAVHESAPLEDIASRVFAHLGGARTQAIRV